MLEPKAEPQMERCPPPYDTRASTADPRLPVVVSPANRSKEQPQQITKSAGSKLELALRYISLTLMVVQYVCQVLLTRHASTRPQMPFIKTVAIGIKEALEALISGFLFLLLVRPKRPLALFDPADMLAMLLPALAYTFKNFLLFVAIDHLNAATFTVSYQLKILATALFLVLMMNRRLSSVQWLSLCVLVGGVAIVELQNAKSAMEELGVVASLSSVNKTLRNVSESELNATNVAAQLQLLGHSHESFWVGFGSVLGACVLSGYSGVYLEMVVKRPGDSLWLRNFQLCFLSSLIGLISALFKDFNQIHTQGPLVGFDLLVWAIILVQVLGGLLVAMVIRYGDNILKAFANAVAILCISVFSFLFFHCSLGWFFGLGTVLVMSAMCLYSLFPAKEAAEEEVN